MAKTPPAHKAADQTDETIHVEGGVLHVEGVKDDPERFDVRHEVPVLPAGYAVYFTAGDLAPSLHRDQLKGLIAALGGRRKEPQTEAEKA